MLKRNHSTLRLFIAFALVVATGLPAYNAPASKASAPQSALDLQPDPEGDGFIYYQSGGELLCRPATLEEALAMSERNETQMHIINKESISLQEEGMLTIVLRGTQQLEGFPAAKNAFIRAANRFSSLIQAAITVIVDVDFGPTRFGSPFGQNVLGSTGTQNLGPGTNENDYPEFRDALVSRANGVQEAALANALPAGSIPTNLGQTGAVFAPSALFRVAGLISPVANPAAEQSQLGSPPSIGFNSNFSFDFEPDDGINQNQIDFDGVAAHEIGHALGFASRVGTTELSPSARLGVSVLDLFRFRPGTTMGTFATAQRVQSSGGTQMFFDGDSELTLSTGRGNGTGGDGEQASHWKDSRFLGTTIGLMDPAVAFGERSAITDNDLRAFDAMGYTLRESNAAAPAIGALAGNLAGDVLTLIGTATDSQGDITLAQTTLLDGSGNILRQDAPFAVNSGAQATFNFNIQINGLANVPAAVRCRIIFTDGQGNSSNAATADFSDGDSGGPTVKKVTFSGSSMTVKGKSFNGQVQLEINGLIVSTKDNSSKKKLKISGNQSALNLRTGTNRVRVRKDNLWSNIELFNL